MNVLLSHFFKLADACGTKTGFLPSIYDGVPCDNGTDIHVQSLGDMLTIVGNIVRILMAFAGALAVIFIIVGAIYYVTSIGDPTRIKRAKEIIIQAITGLIIVLVAYSAITFLSARL